MENGPARKPRLLDRSLVVSAGKRFQVGDRHHLLGIDQVRNFRNGILRVEG